MSEPVPVKMSQFDVTPTFPSGSYFVAVIPDGPIFKNVRVDPATVLSGIYSTRWKLVPANSFSPGNDGDEAKDASYYYINVGGVWYRHQHGPLF